MQNFENHVMSSMAQNSLGLGVLKPQFEELVPPPLNLYSVKLTFEIDLDLAKSE